MHIPKLKIKKKIFFDGHNAISKPVPFVPFYLFVPFSISPHFFEVKIYLLKNEVILG
jgi:hypothetical protein